MMTEIFEILKYTIPALITAAVASYFLKQFIHLEIKRTNLDVLAEKKKNALTIRLDAYERLTLFLERTELSKLTDRVTPNSYNKIEYAKLLIQNINTEFEHNLVQQIYMSADCWKAINDAKKTTLNIITAQSMKENISTGLELKNSLSDEESPTKLALQLLQAEVKQLF